MDSVITINSSGNIVIRYLRYADDEIGFKSAVQGQKLVYKLASPIIYDLSAPVIRSLLGINRVWSNNGEITHLEYSKDIETVFNDHSDSINAISIRETVENYEEESVLSISDGAEGAPMALTVGIGPVQDKHGLEPYPGGASKNKLRLILSDIMSFNSNWAWTGKTATLSGITVEVLTDSDDNILGFTANGQATASIWFVFRRFEDNEILIDGSLKIGGYVSTTGSPSTTFGYQMYFKNNNGSNVIATGVSNNYLTITNSVSTGDTSPSYSSFVFRNGVSVSSLVFKPMILLTSETNYDFVPYSNICPITGWTGAEITRTGKNLLDMNHITIVEGQYIEVDESEAGIIKSAAGFNYVKDYIPVVAGETYTFSVSRLATNYGRGTWACYYDTNFNTIIPATRLSANSKNAGDILVSFVIPDGACFVRFDIPWFTAETLKLVKGTNIDGAISGQTQAYPITFLTSAGTVYGGTLTVNKDGTGCLAVDKATVTFDGSSDETINNGNASGLLRMLMKLPNGALLTGNGMSDKLSWKATADEAMVANTVHWYEYPASSSVPGVFADCRFAVGTYDNTSDSTRRAYLAQNPIQFVYELSEKITYNISAPVVKSLLGTNNIWADTGKILSVDYTRDTTMAVNSKVDTAYYEWQMQQAWDNIDTKAIPMSSIAYDIIHDYEKRRSL